MTELPPFDSDPDDLKDWLASLTMDELMAVARRLGGDAVLGSLGLSGGPAARNREIDLAPPPDEPQLLTLTIELRDSEPRIWRTLTMPGDLTLDAVHNLFQAAMGWSDSHLHRFQPGTGDNYHDPYFITEFDEDEGDEGTREDAVRLDQVLRSPGDQLTYSYDFGDGWEHRVTLESVAPLTQDNRDPSCLAGAQACPPEDVGGIHTHIEVAQWLRAGAPEDAVPDPFDTAEEARAWLPLDYDPDAFDAAEATTAMRAWASGEHLPWHSLPEPLAQLIQSLPQGEGWMQVMGWLMTLHPRTPVALAEDDVRRAARPWRTMLDAVGSGTKLTAAGYLPPAMVEQLARDTGVTDWWIGKANREDLTYPVAELRQAAQDVGLLRKAKGTLAPTARARGAAGDPWKLVSAVLERLPLGKGFEAEAGWFALLGTASGASGRDLDSALARILADRGWRTGASTIDATQAHHGARPTLDALESMAGGRRAVDRELFTRLARAALFGVAEPT